MRTSLFRRARSVRRVVLGGLVAALTVGLGPAVAAASTAAPARAAVVHPAITSISPGVGRATGGDIVDVYGSNLNLAGGVLFGSTRSPSVHVYSPTHLIARTPAHAVGYVYLAVVQKPGTWTSPPSTRVRFDFVQPTADPKFGAPKSIDTSHSALLRISCPTADFCGVAEPQALFTLVNGQRTNAITLSATQRIDSIDCPAVGECVAVGHLLHQPGTAAVLHEGVWTVTAPLPLPDSTYAWSVSCGSPKSCWAIRYPGLRWHWNGASWTGDTQPFEWAQISCVSETYCLLVGYGKSQIWNGTTWSAVTGISGATFIPTSVSCGAVDSCIMTGADGPWRFDGQMWARDQLGETLPTRSLVDCPAADRCVAVAAKLLPASYVTYPAWRRDADGWHAIDNVDRTYSPQSLSCLAIESCTVGLNGIFTVLTGTTWTRSARLDLSTGQVTSVACPSVAVCVANDAYGSVLYERNGVWSLPESSPDVDVVLGTIACTREQYCLADRRTWDGTHWHTGDPVPLTAYGNQLKGCRGDSFCWAVWNDSAFYRWNGIAWAQTDVLPGDRNKPASLDCVVGGVCYLVRTDGTFWAYRQDRFFRSGATAAVRAYTDMSCVQVNYCVAVSYTGVAAVFDGAAWLDTPGGFVGRSIDCKAVSDCLAVSSTNEIYHWDGVMWSMIQAAPASPGGVARIVTHRGNIWIVITEDGHAIESV